MGGPAAKAPELVLIHSRFRPKERSKMLAAIVGAPPARGQIVVATQAVEAGVDISAITLITDLAPWPSLVQRFGRCNREGTDRRADVYWLDLNEKHAAPYETEQLDHARIILNGLNGQSVAPANLPEADEPIQHQVVLRRRDLEGLFDTTPDLSGNYLDVSRFVRGADEADLQVFWRSWASMQNPSETLHQPDRNELCSVPVWQLREFLGSRAANRSAWRWDYLDRAWQRIPPRELRPGQTLLMRAEDGGYSVDAGWETTSNSPVPPVSPQVESPSEPESYEDERTNTSQGRWVTLRDHIS